MSELKKYVGLNVIKPVGVLNRDINIDFKTLFPKLGKAAWGGIIERDIESVGDNLKEALFDLEVEDKVGALAWALSYTALASAVEELVIDGKDLFDLDKQPDEQQQQELASTLDNRLLECEVAINETFFDQPQNFPFLQVFQEALKPWLVGLGLESLAAQSLVERLPNKFVLALHLAWQKQPDQYEPIKKAINTPFTKSMGKRREWLQYHAWLGEQVNERMFAEAFSLKQVYVRLRAYYEKQVENRSEKERHVVCLHKELESWVKNYKADDTVRVISGGPGSGKSSFCKMFAAEIAKELTIPVLFVPLHEFEHEANLIQAVERFIAFNCYLSDSPLDARQGEKRILVIFDGLDELPIENKVAAEVANNFINKIIRCVSTFNRQGLQRQFLISGRDLTIQISTHKLNRERQILHVLPYFLEKTGQFVDQEKLLNIDQRDEWWANYARVKGKNFKGIPTKLKRGNLIEITQQPLLNYLVALSYEQGQLDFNHQATLNEVYEDLLNAVFERQWEGGRQHESIDQINKENFFHILEEIALAVWHGNGRTATVNDIYARCKNSDLSEHVDIFANGAKKGVTRLLTAFYFRQSGEIKGKNIFEFTHKSFGEYLIARRLVRMLEEVQTMLNDSSKNQHDELKHWVELCGTTAIDEYLYEFIQNEVRLHQPKEWQAWQQTLISLIESAVKYGMPMEKLGLSSFQIMLKQSRNAEEALLAMHFACAQLTEDVLDINWGSSTAFGTWLKRLQEQRENGENKLVLKCLGYLNLQFCSLYFQDLYGANLKGANLIMVNLRGANLERTNFEGASLRGASLVMVNLRGANLEGTYLEGTNLGRANLKGANLKGANFKEANLKEVNLKGANLKEANLEEANLEEASLEEANLKRANLKRANLEKINFKNVKFKEANFQEANLKGANFKTAELEKVNFEKAILYRINLEEATLKEVNFKGATLYRAVIRNANLEKVNFQEANLKGVNLKGVNLKGIDFKGADIEGAILPVNFKLTQN